MQYLTKKYINLISNRLEKFVWKNSNLASMRCPLCGDSKKNKRKARGNFYSYKGDDFYNCYNCGEPQGFESFLYQFDRNLYREYKLEKFQDSIVSTPKKEDTFETDILSFKSKPTPVKKESPLDNIKRISELKEDHPARGFANLRELNLFVDRIYYVSDFPEFCKQFDGLEKWSKIDKHPRMLFPCYSKDKQFIGFSARAYTDNFIRYCTWKDTTYEESKILFGLDTVDETKTVYVVEGVIDSLMIDNAVAVMSSALNSVDNFDNTVLIFDNQPRNRDIVKLVKKAIEDGKRVVIWPNSFPAKDLNEAVCDHGFTREDLMCIIKNYTFSGLMAEVQFKRWKKI